jgi:hypothetical protein
MPEPLMLGIHVDDVPGTWLFVPASGRRGDGKRVWKCFPTIQAWQCDVTFMVADETITESVFRYHLEQAGKFIGIGFFRPRNNGYFGRFKVNGMSWEKLA